METTVYSAIPHYQFQIIPAHFCNIESLSLGAPVDHFSGRPRRHILPTNLYSIARQMARVAIRTVKVSDCPFSSKMFRHHLYATPDSLLHKRPNVKVCLLHLRAGGLRNQIRIDRYTNRHTGQGKRHLNTREMTSALLLGG